MLKNVVSTTSSVMLRFEGGAGGAGGFGGFDFNGADFGDIFGDIFGDLFGGGGRRGGRANNGPMKGANIRKSIRITFEEAVFGCKKELEVILKVIHVRHVEEQVQNRGRSPETCPKCGGKGQVVYTSQSSSERYRTSRPVRTVVVPVR